MLSGESEMPLVRRVGNTIFAALLSIVGSRKISDSASGMRVFRGVLPILYPLPDGLDFTPAMSTRAVYEGINMVEVPIPYKERVGRSKLNPLKDGIRFLRSILWTALLYDPQRFFGTLGLAMLVAGAGARPWPDDLLPPESPPPRRHDLPAVRRADPERGRRQPAGVRGHLSGDPRAAAGPAAASSGASRVRGVASWPALGVVMIVVGIGLMTPAALEWLATRQITSHWSYFAAGGTPDPDRPRVGDLVRAADDPPGARPRAPAVAARVSPRPESALSAAPPRRCTALSAPGPGRVATADGTSSQADHRPRSVRFRSALIMLIAVSRPVFGFSVGMFWSTIRSSPNSPRTSISWVLRTTVGSATTRTVVLSRPSPARLTAAATFTFSGKRSAASRAGPS